MSKMNNYCIIETEFLMSDEDLLSLSRSERYVFVCAWNYAVFRRRSTFVRTEFESNLARLYDLRRRTVAETMQKCGENARLVVIGKDTYTIVGVEDKHRSLKGWSDREIEKPKPLKTKTAGQTKLNYTKLYPEAHKLACILLEQMKENDPKATAKNLDKWVSDIEKLIRLDKRTASDVEAVIRWCQKDDFWQTVILSGGKLRKQFPQLWLKMSNGKENKSTTPNYQKLN